MRRTWVAVCFVVMVCAVAVAEPVKVVQTPVVTPPGDAIVFVYGGDLWRMPIAGGQAQRLTGDPGSDHHPVVSPDGKHIVFASNRSGGHGSALFRMPARGGEVTQLTWDTSDNTPLSFSEDGQRVFFSSGRSNGYPDRYRVYAQAVFKPVEPQLVLAETVGAYEASEHGVLVSRRGVSSTRKHYRGSGNSDLWLVRQGAWQQLTEHAGRDRWPRWLPDGRYLWVSDRDGADNLWLRTPSGTERQLTFFEDDGVVRPSVSADGKIAAFTRGFDLYVQRLEGEAFAKPVRLVVDVPRDRFADADVHRSVSSATEVEPSPDGKSLAFVARGEVFVRRLADGQPVRLTRSPARDEHVVWHPDGKRLYFVSDQGANRDIYRLSAAEGEDARLHRAFAFEVAPVVRDPADDAMPLVSPNGKQLVFVRDGGNLHVLDLEAQEGASPQLLLTGWNIRSLSFSPDGKWLTFAREDDNFNSDVFIFELATGQLINVSQHPDSDWSPAWSPDGKKLAFVSERWSDGSDLCLVYLREQDDQLTKAEEADAKEDASAAEMEKKKAAKPEATVEVTVDGDELWRRVRRIKPMLGKRSWARFSSDSKQLLFRSDHLGQSDLFAINIDRSGLRRLTTGHAPTALTVHAKTKMLFYLRGNKTPATLGERGSPAKTYSFSARLSWPIRQEREQIFDEVWGTLARRWYDPQLNGLDWQAMRAKYREVAATRPTLAEFHGVIRRLLGELNGSHLGISGGQDRRYISVPATGRLGLELVPGKAGWLVKDVLPDGPCDKERARLAVGDTLLELDGVSLTAEVNLAQRLAGLAGVRTPLVVSRARIGTETARVERLLVRPASDATIRALRYRRWAQRCRDQVEQGSLGRLGYLHIRGMNVPSLERFETELYARGNGKAGLVIDVRNNGGGWTCDYLLAILHTPKHAYTVPRGGDKGYPEGRRPVASWTKPIVVLCNERSFSNAEIFAHAIKTTKRGKLVGMPTNGGVISTGSRSLLDGSKMRVPFRGWFVVPEGADMELNGAVPDIVVDNQPGSESDDQLEAAIGALLSEF